MRFDIGQTPFNLNITMGKLHDFATRHHKFTESIEGRLVNIVDGNQDLLNLNREQLKEEHKTSKGVPVSPNYRSDEYAKMKGFKTPDLYLTGKMFESMILETDGKTFEINSSVDYTPKLIEQYGSEIFGIAKTKQKTAKQITTKELTNQYKSECYGK